MATSQRNAWNCDSPYNPNLFRINEMYSALGWPKNPNVPMAIVFELHKPKIKGVQTWPFLLYSNTVEYYIVLIFYLRW